MTLADLIRAWASRPALFARGDRLKSLFIGGCFFTPASGPRRELKMATKAKAQVKEEAPDKDAEGTPDTQPLLDLNDAGVKKMIKAAKKRGYVTHDQVNAVLPSEEVTSDQIEDVFAMLNEMGINVVESEEAEAEEAPEEAAKEEPEEDEAEGGELVEVQRSTPAETKKSEPGERTDDPVRM